MERLNRSNGATGADIRATVEVLEGETIYEEAQTLLSSDDSGNTKRIVLSKYTKNHKVHRTVNYVLTTILVCSIIGVWSLGFVLHRPCKPNAESFHYYSPALEATKPGSRVTRLNHTEWSPFSPSHDDPLEYVDGNWTALLRIGMMSLSEEDLHRTGASPDTAVRLPPESGGGYLAYLASHHHLHCLYLLHQSLHADYYSSRSVIWEMSQERRLSHWDHCIESLRQYVTCNADTTVVTHNWFENYNLPVPTQGNPRRCADWDAHFRWQVERQVNAPKEELVKPKGVVEMPMLSAKPPEDYLEMYASGIEL
ncbi:uncharacterized protein F4822DRAFT_387477 [Hypoxylon trugodes]|uniref:uncharacterized protein n=1 Tax=Hypoxylon trugodes TaxID=326681 RepID=UPI00218F8AB6|nr:uncharacterized protein F4822DRAFT_387477 [Hypoxylon trugodes]KAI1394214.1 hypothetical protein F4822DRAFT_387477 [Hypoxylon trugodes]